jgi:iron complex transport system substrate-binding protein
MNVVTLLPSATEVVFALGVEPVGVSHECDYPPEAADLPAVEYSRVDADASTAEIDRQVQEAEESGGVYGIDVELLDELDPDLVVTQGVCDVCAVDEVLVEDAVREIDANPEVLTTDPHSVGDVFDDIRRVGAALDREAEAAELVASLEARVESVRERAADYEHKRVAVLDWTDPVMVAGHWVPELVAAANCEYGMADPGDASTPREWAEVREYDPEALVVAPCGYDLAQTRANLSDLTDRPGWEALTAVGNGDVWAVDGNHFLNRPGPRVVDSLEHLAGVLHEEFETPSRDVAAPLSELAATR